MKITNVSCDDGVFKDGDGSFTILVDDGASYDLYRVEPTGVRKSGTFIRSQVGDYFPEAIGKFMPEMSTLDEPIEISRVPNSYHGVDALLMVYFQRYGVEFS